MSVIINNEYVFLSDWCFLGMECDRDIGEGMNENDIVY